MNDVLKNLIFSSYITCICYSSSISEVWVPGCLCSTANGKPVYLSEMLFIPSYSFHLLAFLITLLMFSHKNDSKKFVFPGTVIDSMFTISNWSPITDSFSATTTQYFRARPRTCIKWRIFAQCVSKARGALWKVQCWGLQHSQSWLEAEMLQAGVWDIAAGSGLLAQQGSGSGSWGKWEQS